jgi:hypothetical protein
LEIKEKTIYKRETDWKHIGKPINGSIIEDHLWNIQWDIGGYGIPGSPADQKFGLE